MKFAASLPVENDFRYREARAFRESIKTDRNTDYAWLCEFARESFERTLASKDKLDEKANDLIKYLGGGTGLFTLAALASVNRESAYVFAWGLFSFLFALVAVLLAILANKPRDVFVAPSIAEAFKYVTDLDPAEHPQAAFLGQWHEAHVGNQLANERQAVLVRWATWSYFASLACLVFPVGAFLIHVLR